MINFPMVTDFGFFVGANLCVRPKIHYNQEIFQFSRTLLWTFSVMRYGAGGYLDIETIFGGPFFLGLFLIWLRLVYLPFFEFSMVHLYLALLP